MSSFSDIPPSRVATAGRAASGELRGRRARSDAHVRELEAQRMVTDPDHPSPADDVLRDLPHLRLDNRALSPGQAAERILSWLEEATDSHAAPGPP